MTDHIAINQQRLIEILVEMRANGIATALTTEIIDKYMGGFHTNKGVAVNDSWNAQFGKYLKAHCLDLGISEQASKERVVVNGHPTKCSRWQVLNG